ncbi:Fanconi anemia group J protein [Sigmodon hispidus]
MAAENPSGISTRKKSDPVLREESVPTVKTEKNVISRSSSPTFGKQTKPVSWPVFNSLRQHFAYKEQNGRPALVSSESRASGSPTFNTEKTASPLTGNCVPSDGAANASFTPRPWSVKVDMSPAKNHSKQLLHSEKELCPDRELSSGSEEAKQSSSNKAIETEAEHSPCFTPELFDPVDTDEENSGLVEADRSSNNSDCFSSEDLFETVTEFDQK